MEHTIGRQRAQTMFIDTYGNDKAGFTTVATIYADGFIFPLALLCPRTITCVKNNQFGTGRHIINNSGFNWFPFEYYA